MLMETLLEMKTPACRDRAWRGWVPLVLLVTVVLCFCGRVPPWALMWLLAVTIFAGFKWWTWWRVIEGGIRTTSSRSLAYLFLWPGMDARRFLALSSSVPNPVFSAWIWAVAKTAGGAILVWGVARFAGNGLLAGWIGMVGFIFLLHFGLFAMLSLFWQKQGICAPPLMNCPIAATSLSDFWGRRWNAGFRDIVFGLFFLPLARRCGATAGVGLTFLLSGLLHELVITLPAGAGFGLPTLYFALQGVAMLAERSPAGVRLGLAKGWFGYAFTFVVVAGPIFALFPPVFVLRVMVPFLEIIKALP
jgi:Membrane bound O-acyl transferase family